MVLEISGGGEGFGRGTHYIQWGQGNLRFATMRLRGGKDEEKKKEKYDKIQNNDNQKIIENENNNIY